MEYKSRTPSTRSTVDSHAFMKEEKFDTWLDLGPLHELIKFCREIDNWDRDHFSSLHCVFSRDTLLILECNGIDPSCVANALISPCLPAKILFFGLTEHVKECHMTPSSILTLYEHAAEAAQIALSKQVSHVMKNISPSLLGFISPSLSVWDTKLTVFPQEITSFAYIVEDAMRILEAYKVLSEYRPEPNVHMRSRMRVTHFKKIYKSEGTELILPSLGAKIYLSLDVSLLKWKQDTFLVTHKYLLEIINKINETFCTLMYSHMIAGTCLSPSHYEWVVRFLSHVGNAVSNFCLYTNAEEDLPKENRAFMYLKVMEGLGVACIILREDKQLGWYNDSLVNQLWQSVVDEGLQPKGDFCDSALFQLFNTFDVSTIAEVLGLVKLCGHPSIEIYRGLEKLKERTHANISVNPGAVKRTIGVLKRELITNFRRKRNIYPKITYNRTNTPRSLVRLFERNIGPDSEEGIKLISGVTIEHWSDIQLLKNEDFDPIDNQLVLLKDKALGLTRSKVYQNILDPESHVAGAGLGPIEERRALLAFLLSDDFSLSFKQYLDSYEHDQVWDNMVLDYLVIKLTAKELEEKPEGRMFGASPAEERNRRVVQEENTMRVMDNFFRDQLMTPDELQMLRKLFSFRHFNKMYPHHKLLQVSFDFSKWNNNMRSASIDVPASETLDKWFGTRIYGKTMRAYESSLFYYKDMLRLTHWEGQEGGIEGLNQATWSLVFLCGIKQALEGLGIVYQLTVKGDDVRAALVIPEKEYQSRGIIRIRDSILGQLSTLCSDMGWQLNPHECFVSLSVIATSKQYQVNDTFLPAATKKIMKMESLSNLIFPTTEDMVASIFSTAHSACSQATTVLPAFVSALFIACRLLIRELWSVMHISVEDVAVLAMWPQCLGGPGSLPLQTFFVRGENDMLSISVSLLRSIVISEHNGLTRQIINILSQPIKHTDDLTLLVTDPYSISLDIPERPNAILKRLMRDHMPKWVKNPDLKTLLNLDAQQAKLEFLDHITSMRPYVAKVVTTLWETSPFYIVDEVLSKFMESSTIFAFFARGKAGRISTKSAHLALSKVLIAAKKRKLYWAKVITSPGQSADIWLGVESNKYLSRNICTTQLVHEIRQSSWGFPLKGITYPSLVDQNMYYTPEDLIKIHPGWVITDVMTTILLETDRAKYQTTDRSVHYSAAPSLAPWLGAQTASKLDLPTTNTRITSPAINKIMRLINLKVNADILGTEFIKTVDMIIASLTGLNLSQLQELVPEAGGGHISHRVAINSFSTCTMPNTRPNLAQLVKLASDAGAALRGDTTNRTVNFAARHFFSIMISLLPLQSQLFLPRNYPTLLYTVFHNDISSEPLYQVCPWCCNNVDDERVSFKVRQRPLLSDFRYLSLVGCSEFEERTLKKNMAEALAGKVRRAAYHEVQNVNDPAIINIASHIIINKLNKERIKIFEAAQGAQFVCTPRAELLEIMSVAMGIKSVSSISLNIIRLLPSEYLYRSVVSEMYSFCLNWLSISSDPENLYQIDNIMDHMNPMSGLFDSLLASQVLAKLKMGAIVHGHIRDFKWSASSHLSGASAMKCFVNYHKASIVKWINGIDPQDHIQMFTRQEDNETIKASLEREYKRVVQAAVNRANVTFNGFRISSHWRRIINLIKDNPRITQEMADAADMNNIDMANHYSREACLYLASHFLDDVIAEVGAFSQVDLCEFWAHSCMCVMVEHYLNHGRWLTDEGEYLNSDQAFRLCEVTALDEIPIEEKSLPVIKQTEFYSKWVNMFTTTEVVYVYNCITLSMEYATEDVVRMVVDAYNRMLNWLMVINERRVMVMTQDNAELVIKKTEHLVENIMHDHMEQLYDPDVNQGRVSLMRLTAMCSLETQEAHRANGCLTKPLMIRSDWKHEHQVADGYQGLKYNDVPPLDQFFIDPTELMRGSGIHNTSVAKYLEIIDKLGLHQVIMDLGTDACVVCLADGLGGVTARFLATYPLVHVVYNSMYYNTRTGKRAADASEALPPTEVTSLPEDVGALQRLSWQGMYPGDITRFDVQSLVVNAIVAKGKSPTLFTMDADIPWHDNMATARDIWFGALSIVAQSQNDHTVSIFKCFGIHHPVVYEFCHTIYCLYSHVHIYRASYTRQRSTEFFIVFSEPRNRDTLLGEVRREYSGDVTFARSLMISTVILEHLNSVGTHYMQFRRSGLNQTLNIWRQIRTFLRSRAYPLDLANILMSLKVGHPLASTCLCLLYSGIKSCLDLSLSQAMNNMHELLVQIKYKHIHHVGIRAGGQHDLTAGWKGLQMSLRRWAKLQVVSDWLDYVIRHKHDAITTWPKNEIDHTYFKIYMGLEPWKGFVAPMLIGHSLVVSCERFNDNWTIMISNTVRKCQQLMGSILLCLGYVYKRSDFAEKALSYMSHNIRIDDCCRGYAVDLFGGNINWAIAKTATSLAAPYTPMIPKYIEIPDIDTLLRERLLVRGFRTYRHKNEENVDPNLKEQVALLGDQIDEEFVEIVDEFKP